MSVHKMAANTDVSACTVHDSSPDRYKVYNINFFTHKLFGFLIIIDLKLKITNICFSLFFNGFRQNIHNFVQYIIIIQYVHS